MSEIEQLTTSALADIDAAADLDALTVPDEQAWIEARRPFLRY